MRSLLVPIDDTDNSANAATYAADMALAIEADIHLLHVVCIPAIPAEMPAGYVLDRLEEDGSLLLQDLAKQLTERTYGQLTIHTHLEIGGVEYHVARWSRQLHPFAVVMGAPGKSAFGAIGGSPAVNAARHLPYPVLVIPAGAAFRRIRRIVLAAETKDIDAGLPVTVTFLRQLRDLFMTRIDVINVAGMNEADQLAGLYSWKKALAEFYSELHFVSAESIPEGVDKYIGEHDADWLMLFPKKHPWFEFHRSRSAAMVARSRVPVLSVCEDANRQQVKTGSVDHVS